MKEDFDDLGYETVLERLNRGDYHDPVQLREAKKWLRGEDKMRMFLADCERASISSALDAKKSGQRAYVLSLLALLVSLISSREEVYGIFRWLIGFLMQES